MQAYTFADITCNLQLLEDMVCILLASISISARKFSFSVHVLLFIACFYYFLGTAKTLEGKVSAQFTGQLCSFLTISYFVRRIFGSVGRYFLKMPCNSCLVFYWKAKFQVVPTVINGGIMALYFICWGKGLLSCGPLM